MTRQEALKDIIVRVQEGEDWSRRIPFPYLSADNLILAGHRDNDLNAIARLEAPLRERGWHGPHLVPGWCVRWWVPDAPPYKPPAVEVEDAPTEARARLLGALNAMLHEEKAV